MSMLKYSRSTVTASRSDLRILKFDFEKQMTVMGVGYSQSIRSEDTEIAQSEFLFFRGHGYSQSIRSEDTEIQTGRCHGRGTYCYSQSIRSEDTEMLDTIKRRRIAHGYSQSIRSEDTEICGAHSWRVACNPVTASRSDLRILKSDGGNADVDATWSYSQSIRSEDTEIPRTSRPRTRRLSYSQSIRSEDTEIPGRWQDSRRCSVTASRSDLRILKYCLASSAWRRGLPLQPVDPI